MSADGNSRAADFAKFIERMSPEEKDQIAANDFRRSEIQHAAFATAFQQGDCYLCDDKITAFNRKRPCIHWLLKPKGFKKKHFTAVAYHFGVFQIQSYLRWVANQQGFAKHINDLPSEGANVLELTIRYKHLEWSFSCKEFDLKGHGTTQHTKYPHYHFQMRVNQKPFIDYGNFHIPLKEAELLQLEVKQLIPNLVKHRFPFGEGMSEYLNDNTVEALVKHSISTVDGGDADLHIDTIAMAEEGKTINGDDLYAIIQEAKSKGVTVASLIHKLPNATPRIMVTPGPGVVEQAPRTRRKKDSDSPDNPPRVAM